MTTALGAGARCSVHQRFATGVCSRCGDYVCGGCGRRLADRLFCQGCGARLAEGHAERAGRAYVLGLLGVHGLLPLAPIAALLASLELSAIAAGRAPLGGRTLARAGLWLGVAGTLMAGGLALVLLR
jgi:hypothetical protein